MPKSLYDANQRFTNEANEIASIARMQGIAAAFKYAELQGFSFRETSHIIQGEVMELELVHILGLK